LGWVEEKPGQRAAAVVSSPGRSGARREGPVAIKLKEGIRAVVEAIINKKRRLSDSTV
jgi:hypothetical protein